MRRNRCQNCSDAVNSEISRPEYKQIISVFGNLRRTVREDGPRATLLGVAVLFIIVNVVFFPYLWAGRSLQESIDHTPSLYPTGSLPAAPSRYQEMAALDPGAPAWYLEPMFAAEHNIIVGQKEPPIWNPYSEYGVPLAADAESQPYSPFAWIPIFWSSAEAYNIYVALRIFAGGVFALLFLRLFSRTIPALTGAVAFMFSGYFWYFLTMPHLSVEMLLPALLYGLELVMRRPKLLWSGVLALIVGCVILGGMPESTTLALVFGAAYFIARVLSAQSLRARWRAFTPYVLLGAVTGLGISAVLVVPLLEYVPISSNLHLGSSVGLIAEPLTWSGLAGYLAPLYSRSLGFIAAKGFFACSALFFALVGLFSSVQDLLRRRSDESTPVILILSAVAIAFVGKRFGLFFINWIGALPVLRVVIFDKYGDAIIGCCVALLAGFGVSRLCEKRITPGALWLAGLIPLAILTGAIGENRQAALHPKETLDYYIFAFSVALVFLALSAAGAAVYYAGKIKYSSFALSALALVLLEPLAAYIVPMLYVVNEPPPQSASPLLGAPYVQYLRAHMTDYGRLYGQGGLLYPQWSEAFELQDVRSLNGLFPARSMRFVNSFMSDNGPGGNELTDRFIGLGDDVTSPQSQRFFALSSVHYVLTGLDITRSPDYRKIAAYRKSFESNGVQVFEFRSPLPRLSLYGRIVQVGDGAGALKELTSERFDPYSEAVVEGSDPSFLPLAQNSRSPVRDGTIQQYTATFIKASVATDHTAFAVLNDTNFPGWQASIDGRSTPIFAANYLFRGIVVPPGTHTIEYRYAPRSFALGGLVTLISLCAVAFMFFPRLKSIPKE